MSHVQDDAVHSGPAVLAPTTGAPNDARALLGLDAGVLPTFVDPESGRVFYPEASIEKWEASHADRLAS